MAAIITDHFRRNQARLLVNDIKASASGSFSDTESSGTGGVGAYPYRGNNRYAIGLGKSDSWPNAGSVSEGDAGFVVPAPTGIRQDDEDVINNLFTLKDIGGTSVKQMIAKNTWTTGRKYKVYDSGDPDAFYATGDLYPCYATHNNSVYIVLSNTAIENGFTSVIGSTTAPSTPTYGFSDPTQGYVWCEVAKLDANDDLISNQFVPIRKNEELATSDQPDAAERRRTAGLLSHVGVASGGTGYSSNTTITATIVKNNGTVATPAISFVPIISGGVIQRVDIRDPQNSPSDTGSYEFWNGADKSDAELMVILQNGDPLAIADRIKSINFVVADPGPGGSAEGGSGALLSGTIAPSTGYAHNAIDILPTWFVGINVDFEGTEDDVDAPAINFRQVSLLKNFVRTDDSDGSTNTLGALKSITLNTPQASALNNLSQGTVLYQQTSGAKFYYDYHVISGGTTTLSYHQNSDGEINQINPTQNNSHGIGTSLNGNQVAAGVSGLNLTPEYQSRVATGTDQYEFNGEVIFHENRKSFSRSETQTEEVKLIIQL